MSNLRFGDRGDPREWIDADRAVREQLAARWSEARSKGAMAMHPDDGWVDRRRGMLVLQYPYTRLPGIKEGDTIAVYGQNHTSLVTVRACTPDPDLFLIDATEGDPDRPDHLVLFLFALLALALLIAAITWDRP